MLLIKNVSISYKTKKAMIPVIDNLSQQIPTGEIVVILGPSGCGKSTLLNAMTGTILPQSGSIEYRKNNVKQTLNAKIHKIGIIPQNCGLLPWKTVGENCLLLLKIRKEDITEEVKQASNKIYEALDIAELLDKYPKQLSGGQVQRAALARAFILKPDLLLMDEPFSALDEITRDEARELFLKIWKQNKPTTILVTHSIQEALYLGNTILVMGTHLGDIRYQMNNPYFGKLYPDNLEYLATKQLLRDQLIPSDERKKTFE